MNAHALLVTLQGRGTIFAVESSGQLRFRAPVGALTEADHEAIRVHKAELIALLFPPPMVDPCVLHLPIEDDTWEAGRLGPADMDKAAGILAYLRERQIVVTASAGEISVIIGRPTSQTMVERITAQAALMRAYLACPHCGRRHSLSPPYGWCWPCAAETWDGSRGKAALPSSPAMPPSPTPPTLARTAHNDRALHAPVTPAQRTHVAQEVSA